MNQLQSSVDVCSRINLPYNPIVLPYYQPTSYLKGTNLFPRKTCHISRLFHNVMYKWCLLYQLSPVTQPRRQSIGELHDGGVAVVDVRAGLPHAPLRHVRRRRAHRDPKVNSAIKGLEIQINWNWDSNHKVV